MTQQQQQRDCFGSTGAQRWSPARAADIGEASPGPSRPPAPLFWSPTSTRTPPLPPRRSISAAGGTAQPFVLDVRDSAAAKKPRGAAAELDDGTLNILVNNAGAIAPAMFADLSEENFRPHVDIHLIGSFRVQPGRIAPSCATDGTGRIINVTSAAGLTGTIGQANYGAAKAGIVGLTKSLARELARQSITVNAVAPLAATAMTANIRSNEKLAAKTLAESHWAAGPSRTR